jgi:hypothetical protein
MNPANRMLRRVDVPGQGGLDSTDWSTHARTECSFVARAIRLGLRVGGRPRREGQPPTENARSTVEALRGITARRESSARGDIHRLSNQRYD